MANLTDLLEQLRIDLDDRVAPQLWSDELLVRFINRSVDEACLRAKLIRDSDSELCVKNVHAGISTYDLDCKILEVHRAMLDGECALIKTDAEALDYKNPRWEQEQGIPTHYILNQDAKWLRLIPRPTAVGVLRLTVWRTPLVKLSLDQPNRCPEIPEIHHWNLLEWAKHLAYSVHDAEAHDPEAANRHFQLFAEYFGRRRSANEIELMKNDRNVKVRPHFK